MVQSQVLISWLLDKDAKPRVYALYLQTLYVNRENASHLCTETLNPDRGDNRGADVQEELMLTQPRTQQELISASQATNRPSYPTH
jgi:hypothetical protein